MSRKKDTEVLEQRLRSTELQYRKEIKEAMKKKGTSFFQDFKKFITKGNILDLAVAVVIGNAFNAIVNNLVNKIIMPIVGWLTGNASLADLDVWIVKPDYVDVDGVQTIVEGTGAGHIEYGQFLQAIVNFLIIALTIFVFIRVLRNSRAKFDFREKERLAKEAEAAAAAEAKAKEEAEAKAKAEAEAAEAAAAAEAARQEALANFYATSAEQTKLLKEIAEKLNK